MAIRDWKSTYLSAQISNLSLSGIPWSNGELGCVKVSLLPNSVSRAALTASGAPSGKAAKGASAGLLCEGRRSGSNVCSKPLVSPVGAVFCTEDKGAPYRVDVPNPVLG